MALQGFAGGGRTINPDASQPWPTRQVLPGWSAPPSNSTQRQSEPRPTPPRKPQTASQKPSSSFDMSMYAGQGKAQPITTQTQGSPYGDYAAPPPDQRPPPFQMAPAQTPWGQSMDPFAERNALLQQIAAQRIQNQIAFNSGGPTNPAAGMNPWINYGQAMQQAGLGGGAPSMSPDYGDSLIGRLNQQFGQPLYPAAPQSPPRSRQDAWIAAGRPGLDPNGGALMVIAHSKIDGTQFPDPTQALAYDNWLRSQGVTQAAPGQARPIQPPSQGTPYKQPPSQPRYGTPPERRGEGRTADWRDADKDGVDDRDQDGPGMPAYPRTSPPGPARPRKPTQEDHDNVARILKMYPGYDADHLLQSMTQNPGSYDMSELIRRESALAEKNRADRYRAMEAEQNARLRQRQEANNKKWKNHRPPQRS